MDTYLKRIGAFHPLLPFGALLPLADGAAADREGEREALLGLYPVDDSPLISPPPPTLITLSGVCAVQAALVTGLLVLIPRVGVKPVPVARTSEVSWNELVRSAEGSDYASRNRYTTYSFGNGRRTRNFYGNTDGT